MHPSRLSSRRTRLPIRAKTVKRELSHVDRDSAPLLLLHGEADTAVPLQQSELLLAKYQAAGAPAELVKNADGHGFWNRDRFTETMDRAAAFFRDKLAAK